MAPSRGRAAVRCREPQKRQSATEEADSDCPSIGRAAQQIRGPQQKQGALAEAESPSRQGALLKLRPVVSLCYARVVLLLDVMLLLCYASTRDLKLEPTHPALGPKFGPGA